MKTAKELREDLQELENLYRKGSITLKEFENRLIGIDLTMAILQENEERDLAIEKELREIEDFSSSVDDNIDKSKEQNENTP